MPRIPARLASSNGLPILIKLSEPRALVEHFFRHEFGRLVAVLTRSLGVRRLALVEDVVQAALARVREQVVTRDPVQGRVGANARRLSLHLPTQARMISKKPRI